jgi:hypothetical protein
MSTQSLIIKPPDEDRFVESASRRMRVRQRSAPAEAPAKDHVAAPTAASPGRPDAARRQVGGARILRRWSVAELIARAGGAPRAIA